MGCGVVCADEGENDVGRVGCRVSGVEQEEEEELEVALANAGTQPDAVVVEAENAGVAHAAVMCARWLEGSARDAPAGLGRGRRSGRRKRGVG